MSVLLVLMGVAALPVLGRLAGVMVRVVASLVGGFFFLAAVFVVLLMLATHGKLL